MLITESSETCAEIGVEKTQLDLFSICLVFPSLEWYASLQIDSREKCYISYITYYDAVGFPMLLGALNISILWRALNLVSFWCIGRLQWCLMLLLRPIVIQWLKVPELDVPMGLSVVLFCHLCLLSAELPRGR